VTSPRGSGGFGYDPMFEIPALGSTVAELDADTKNALSHRGQAMRLLRRELELLVGLRGAATACGPESASVAAPGSVQTTVSR
jgi:hypothetical protein